MLSVSWELRWYRAEPQRGDDSATEVHDATSLFAGKLSALCHNHVITKKAGTLKLNIEIVLTVSHSISFSYRRLDSIACFMSNRRSYLCESR